MWGSAPWECVAETMDGAATLRLDPGAYADLTWAHFLVGNLLPVTLGNIVGGGVMIGILYWTIFHHLAKEKAPQG